MPECHFCKKECTRFEVETYTIPNAVYASPFYTICPECKKLAEAVTDPATCTDELKTKLLDMLEDSIENPKEKDELSRHFGVKTELDIKLEKRRKERGKRKDSQTTGG